MSEERQKVVRALRVFGFVELLELRDELMRSKVEFCVAMVTRVQTFLDVIIEEI